MQTENQYIGDDKFTKMLEHYQCPTPLEVVKMRFAGALCSPNLELRPTDVISSFWPSGQAPRLETKSEADLFFKFFMGLWDDVFKKIKNNDIRLETLKFKNADDLRLNCERRYAEVELGFVEGFWGGKSDLKIPEYLAQLIDSVSELAGIYNTLAKNLTTVPICPKLQRHSRIPMRWSKNRSLSLLRIRFCRGLRACNGW